MKHLIKITLLLIALVSTLLISGCGNEDRYASTWIAYEGGEILHRITFQPNGKEYIVTEETLFYAPEKDYPKPQGVWSIFASTKDNMKKADGTYDIHYILHKDSRTTTARAVQPRNDKDKDLYKDQLSYDEGRTLLRYIEKDNTILLYDMRYKKQDSPEDINSSLTKMQTAMKRELKIKFHKYGERAIGDNHNLVVLGNITFDDSALTEAK